MRTLTFVRHAQSVANAGGLTLPHATIPLSELGHRQAAALADALDPRPSRIWVSAYGRTAATAAPFCARVGLVPEVHEGLHEFSSIDPARLEGLTGEERRPIAEAYWAAADPARRMGPSADTFAEFDARVDAFVDRLDEVPDRAVFFGHGQWFALVVWKLLGFGSTGADGMRAFRRFLLGLPMPNGATWTLRRADDGHWHARADERVTRLVAAVA